MPSSLSSYDYWLFLFGLDFIFKVVSALRLILVVALMVDPTKEVASITPGLVPVSLSHSQLAQRVTSVLLNEKNFHA